jgi:excisionase family DNA binding protein
MTPMTRDDLLALPPTIGVATAARALGCSRGFVYGLVRRGEFPCRILRLGNKYLILTADLLRVLGMSEDGSDVARRQDGEVEDAGSQQTTTGKTTITGRTEDRQRASSAR